MEIDFSVLERVQAGCPDCHSVRTLLRVHSTRCLLVDVCAHVEPATGALCQLTLESGTHSQSLNFGKDS